MEKNNYNDLISRELTDKYILLNKRVTIIEKDVLRMNENLNYQLENYKNTINEKLKLNKLIIDNFIKDITYRISISNDKNDIKNDIKNNKNDMNDMNDNYKKELQLLKKEYDEKIIKNYDYIQETNYQLIKFKHITNDKINTIINDNDNNDDNNNEINNEIIILKMYNRNIIILMIIQAFIFISIYFKVI
jgi:hypothetical protein